MTKSIDKKLAILESYLNENGHVGEAIGVSSLRDSKLVSTARSISEGRCAPPTPSDSCHDCDKVSEDIHMVIAYPANSKEYPKIKRMVRWHTDEAAQIDETSHVITGADEVSSPYGVNGWKNEACNRGIKLRQAIPMTLNGRTSDYIVVRILNPTPAECEGPDCGKEPLKIIVRDTINNKNYGTTENPIEVPRPIEYTYRVTGWVKPNCTISNEEIELTEDQFMRTCFLPNDNSLPNDPDRAHITEYYTTDYSDSKETAAWVDWVSAKEVLDVESSAMLSQTSSCPSPDPQPEGACPKILDADKYLDLIITSPETTSKHGHESPINVSVELKTKNGSAIPEDWLVKVFYTDRRTIDKRLSEGGPHAGAFCSNLGKVSDGNYSGRITIEHVNPGIFQMWATVLCGPKTLTRSNPIWLEKNKVGD